VELVVAALVGVAFGFAVSMGAHYTGACMGMSYASGALRAGSALLLMAPLTLIGAVLASGGVKNTVGHGLLAGAVGVGVALAIVASAFALTTAYNFARIPTSTIQILVFSVVGAGLERGIAVDWPTVEHLLELWALAPFAAFGLGYLLVRSFGRPLPPGARDGTGPGTALGLVAIALVGMGAAASFAMGANDVANASGAFVMTGLLSPTGAALLGGIGLAVGVLTWGRPLLRRVAFDLVKLDLKMAVAAQLAQAVVILSYVTFGYFTSMNQALVGAMTGTGYARGVGTVRWRAIRDILVGWGVGPPSGAACGFAAAFVIAALGWG